VRHRRRFAHRLGIACARRLNLLLAARQGA
jgi:hypothetical protein